MKHILKKSLPLWAAATLLLGACDTLMNDSEGAAASYSLTLLKNEAEPAEAYNFPAVYPDYGDVEGLELTVANAGPGTAAGIEISLSGTGSGAFSLSPELIEQLPAGDAASFTVRPVSGLGGGVYRATVTVHDGAKDVASFEVAFTVSVTPLYGISLDVEEGHTFPPKGEGYEGLDALTVTVTNTGNEGTSELTIALTGESAADFDVSADSISNIAAGGTAKFTVQPASALVEGIYTATVTVGGGHDLAAEFTVSFRVFSTLIEIDTEEELAGIGNTSPVDVVYILKQNLTLDNWTPITNTAETAFTGVFMGGGNTITINSFDPDVLETGPVVGYIGIFGYISGGRVENLVVDLNMPDKQDMKAYSDNINDENDQYVGGVSGYAVDTEFDGITVLGDIYLNKNDRAGIYLGGITGYLKGGSISNSIFGANLTNEWTYTSAGSVIYTGGLAGYGDATELSGSSVSGRINAYANFGNIYAGGVVGRITKSAISHIAVTGDVEASGGKVYVVSYATRSYYAHVGGIAGSFSGEIRECYSTGDVMAVSYIRGGNSLYAGGIAGNATGLISDSYSRGAVTARVDPAATPSGGDICAGGIVGRVGDATVQNCYAAGTVTADGKVSNSNSFYVHAGGITALMNTVNYYINTIQNCAALAPEMNWKPFSSHVNILQRIGNRIRGYVKSTQFATTPYGEETLPQNNIFINNIANRDMAINYEPSTEQAAKIPEIILAPGPDTPDGADCDAKPAQSVYADTLGWNFGTVWRMGSDGYPALRWQ